jgi:predicted dehydrogenase
MPKISRRSFLIESAPVLAGTGAAGQSVPNRAAGPNEKFVIACMGIRGRGGSLLHGFAELPEVEVAVICDLDTRLFGKYVASVEQRQKKRPRTETDFRRILDDKSIDALVIGTPDHWHAIPTILACQAGKHVYVEKPASHNIREGEVMVAAARKYSRVVQVGIQSRSGRHFEEAFDYIRTGALGKVILAKAWESARQESIGHPADAKAPDGIDYDMWLGPAPKRPFNPNRFHGRWRWFFDYGTGDLGNDGVHRIDYARRGLEAGFAARGEKLPERPTSVSASGGKHYFDDAQEWPDTLLVTWDYPGATLVYEMRLWSPYPLEGAAEGAAIYGDQGYLIISNEQWRAFGAKGEPGPSGRGGNGDDDVRHKRNFLKCIRSGGSPTCDIAIGQATSALSHMGNIAWRVNRKLRLDPGTGRFRGDDEANGYLGRTYREPWVLPRV